MKDVLRDHPGTQGGRQPPVRLGPLDRIRPKIELGKGRKLLHEGGARVSTLTYGDSDTPLPAAFLFEETHDLRD